MARVMAGNKRSVRGRMRTRYLASAASVLVAAALVAPAGPTASAAAPVLTDFALAANGFSTQVDGGALPVESGVTGAVGLSCTRFAGRSNRNDTAAVNLPRPGGLVRVGATTTRTFTTSTGDTVSSNGVNDVASVLIGSRAVAGLEIRGIETRTRVWHDSAGFHREQFITVAGVTRYVGGEGENVAAIPTNQNLSGQRIRLPGLATVNFGIRAGSVSDNHAAAKTKALRIEITGTGTEVVVGGSGARIEGGDVNGIMTGQVWGSQVRGLGGIANSGRTAAQGLSCVGTDGAFEVERVAAVRIPGVAALGEIVSRARGSQTAGGAFAEGISTVTGARFLGRQLVITGIRAQGLVNRSNDGTYARIARGTTVARIELGGRRLELPRAGRALVIPGIARITRGLVERPGSNTIKVVGLRVQLLEGSRIESTVDLANVLLQVKRG
jgi:hypothetical protein